MADFELKNCEKKSKISPDPQRKRGKPKMKSCKSCFEEIPLIHHFKHEISCGKNSSTKKAKRKIEAAICPHCQKSYYDSGTLKRHVKTVHKNEVRKLEMQAAEKNGNDVTKTSGQKVAKKSLKVSEPSENQSGKVSTRKSGKMPEKNSETKSGKTPDINSGQKVAKKSFEVSEPSENQSGKVSTRKSGKMPEKNSESEFGKIPNKNSGKMPEKISETESGKTPDKNSGKMSTRNSDKKSSVSNKNPEKTTEEKAAKISTKKSVKKSAKTPEQIPEKNAKKNLKRKSERREPKITEKEAPEEGPHKKKIRISTGNPTPEFQDSPENAPIDKNERRKSLIFECQYCKHSVSGKGNIRSHEAFCAKYSSIIEGDQCLICQRSYAGRSGIRNHMTSMHKDFNPDAVQDKVEQESLEDETKTKENDKEPVEPHDDEAANDDTDQDVSFDNVEEVTQDNYEAFDTAEGMETQDKDDDIEVIEPETTIAGTDEDDLNTSYLCASCHKTTFADEEDWRNHECIRNEVNQNVIPMIKYHRGNNSSVDKGPELITKVYKCPICLGKLLKVRQVLDHLALFHRISYENQKRMKLKIRELPLDKY